MQLPPFYFCPIEEGLASAGREGTALSRDLCDSKARKLVFHVRRHPRALLRY